jgi:hypothetical protein
MNQPDVLDQLIDSLEPLADGKPGEDLKHDALDRVLASSPRSTRARSLRHHPAVRAVHEQLARGAVSADAVRALLEMVHKILAAK